MFLNSIGGEGGRHDRPTYWSKEETNLLVCVKKNDDLEAKNVERKKNPGWNSFFKSIYELITVTPHIQYINWNPNITRTRLVFNYDMQVLSDMVQLPINTCKMLNFSCQQCRYGQKFDSNSSFCFPHFQRFSGKWKETLNREYWLKIVLFVLVMIYIRIRQ